MQTMNTRRVLYIEDHEDTRELVTLVLEQKSYEVVTGSTYTQRWSRPGRLHRILIFTCWTRGCRMDSRVGFCADKYVSSTKRRRLFFTPPQHTRSIAMKALHSGATGVPCKSRHRPSDLCNLVTTLIESHRRYRRVAVSNATYRPVNLQVGGYSTTGGHGGPPLQYVSLIRSVLQKARCSRAGGLIARG